MGRGSPTVMGDEVLGKFPECEGIEPESPGLIIFVVKTIEPDVTNPSRERSVTSGSMVFTKTMIVCRGFDARY